MGALQLLGIWAKDKGVELNGIKPVAIPGRGIGVVASRRLKVMIDSARPIRLYLTS
jgi:hypothetical protein